jgi:hypothetical protein
MIRPTKHAQVATGKRDIPVFEIEDAVDIPDFVRPRNGLVPTEIEGNSSSSGAVASSASRDFGGGLDQPFTLFAHDGVFVGKVELARNPHRLVAAVLEELDVPFGNRGRLLLA